MYELYLYNKKNRIFHILLNNTRLYSIVDLYLKNIKLSFQLLKILIIS